MRICFFLILLTVVKESYLSEGKLNSRWFLASHNLNPVICLLFANCCWQTTCSSFIFHLRRFSNFHVFFILVKFWWNSYKISLTCLLISSSWPQIQLIIFLNFNSIIIFIFKSLFTWTFLTCSIGLRPLSKFLWIRDSSWASRYSSSAFISHSISSMSINTPYDISPSSHPTNSSGKTLLLYCHPNLSNRVVAHWDCFL